MESNKFEKNQQEEKYPLSASYKRKYTYEQIYDIYNNDYINCTLKNAVLSGLFDMKFIPIKNLFTRLDGLSWEHHGDPYLRDINKDKLKLGYSILEIGTQYPLIVSRWHEYDEKIYILEGNHRLTALKELVKIGKISEDFKICCLFLNILHPEWEVKKETMKFDNDVKYRYIIENHYGDVIFYNNTAFKNAITDIHNHGGVFINDYTIESSTKYAKTLFISIKQYPIFIRDLIYYCDKFIQPSKIINNEEEFNKWIRE